MVNKVDRSPEADRFAVLRDRPVWAVATLTFPLIFAAQTVLLVVAPLLAQRSGWAVQASEDLVRLLLLVVGAIAALLYWRGGAISRGIALALAMTTITLAQWVFFE